MYVKHLSSLQFLTYVAFFAVVIAAIMRFLPGKAPALRREPYRPEELGAEDQRLAKYFVASGAFLVVGGLHMAAKNLPWVADWLARGGYAGHLVRDLSNTHLMIVGGGTLAATGLTWYVLPRVVGRPLASPGLAQASFWFTAVGLAIFYLALVENGIVMSNLIAHGSNYEAAKAHMGNWYKMPVGMGAGIMGLGYWCFAANVFLTVFQARLVRIPKPDGHLWKFFVTGTAALTVGTVQGVIQVQPANADWLYNAGHAGEWIDPISHAHINLVTGLTMLVAGICFYLLPTLGGARPSRRLADGCFWSLLAGSLAFYFSALFLGLHEGRLVVNRLLTPEQAEKATALHPFLIMGSGIAMFAAFWLLLAVLVRTSLPIRGPLRPFVLAACAALALGTLQGPVQAFPAVTELLDEGADAGDVIVNLHSQLNMLGGLMVILVGLGLAVLVRLGAAWPSRNARVALVGISLGMACYYAFGVAFAALEAHKVMAGATFEDAVSSLEPWSGLVLVPAATVVFAGFVAYWISAWRMTERQWELGRRALATVPRRYTGRVPRRVRARPPAALAGYELPLAVLGFPGVGWLFAGFPFTASILLLAGPALAWAVIPIAFSPYADGPLRGLGWKVELFYLPLSAVLSAALLFRAHARRRRRIFGDPPKSRMNGRPGRYRTRVSVAIGSIALVLVCLPFVPALAGIGSSTVHYSYQPRLTPEVTGQFLATPNGIVKLFSWQDPQQAFPPDALRLHAGDFSALVARAAAVDDPAAYQLFDLDRGGRIPLHVTRSSPTSLQLAPARALESGRYVFVGSHEGMFGGRDYAYLSIVAPGEATTPIGAGGPTSVPAVADSLLPLAAALVALTFSALLAASFTRRPAGQKALWAAGFALFATAALAEGVSQRTGWTPGLFRTYYAAGGVLTVAYLGAGSAWLLLRPRARDALVGALLVATLAAIVTVALAPVDAQMLAATPSGRPPGNGALGGHAALWAIALNAIGTVFLLGGSLYSILRRQRVRANVWIATGAMVVALATGLSRAGDYSFVYAGQLVGVAIMFAGFKLTGASRRAREPAAPRQPLREGIQPG
jgi:hypothetical protein